MEDIYRIIFAVVAAGYMLIQQRKNVPDGIIKEQQKATSNANTELRTDSQENENRTKNIWNWHLRIS